VDVERDSGRDVLASHPLLTRLAVAATLFGSGLSVFPELDRIGSVAATVGYDVFAKTNHLDVKVFVLGSRDCSLHCVGHCSIPFSVNLADENNYSATTEFMQEKNACATKYFSDILQSERG
jgi:hypothetical protein